MALVQGIVHQNSVYILYIDFVLIVTQPKAAILIIRDLYNPSSSDVTYY